MRNLSSPVKTRDIRQKVFVLTPSSATLRSTKTRRQSQTICHCFPIHCSLHWSHQASPVAVVFAPPKPEAQLPEYVRTESVSLVPLAALLEPQVLMPPVRTRGKMKEEAAASISGGTQANKPIEPLSTKETVLTAPMIETPTTSPTFQAPAKTPPRRVIRLKCPTCDDYPDGFRSEHELRRHTNRIHRKTRKVWMTIDTSPDKSFLANCKACQTGKRYNECYNAASHLRRMHFHPHKRGERKMTAAEARRGGKPGDLDPPMDVLKTNWLREVEEVIGEGSDDQAGSDEAEVTVTRIPRTQPQSIPIATNGKAPPTPTTPSTRSMAIDSIVDKVDAS